MYVCSIRSDVIQFRARQTMRGTQQTTAFNYRVFYLPPQNSQHMVEIGLNGF